MTLTGTPAAGTPALRRRRRARTSRAAGLLVVLLTTALVVAGCGGSSKEEPQGKSNEKVMEQAKKQFDDAAAVHITLSTDSTPSSGNGVLGATGDVTHDPAFKGEVKVVISGLTATVPITSVGGKVYAKLPLQTKYAVIDPGEYGAPDPADFADPDNGLSALLTMLDGLKKEGESRKGEQILTTYTGALSGAAVKKVIPSADAKQTYQTKVGVDQDGYATTVRITGTFFSGSDDVTYDVTFDDYDQDVTISAPPA